MHPYYASQQRALLARSRGGVVRGFGGYVPNHGAGPEGHPVPAAPAALSPDVVALIQAIRGGSVGDGIACPPRPGPSIPVGADGCPQGALQCKQDIGINSGLILIGASLTFPVVPRSYAQPRALIYTGPVGAFTLDRVDINGTDYANGSVNADRWLAANDVDRSVDYAQFSRNSPMFLTVTNVGAVDATFTASLPSSVDRGPV